MIVYFLYLFTLLQGAAFAQDLHSRLFMPSSKHQSFSELEAGVRYQEEEYEKQDIVQNQTELRNQEFILSHHYLLKENQLIQFYLDVISEGKGEESFPVTAPATIRRYKTRGLKRIGAGYLYRHKNLDTPNLAQGLGLKIYANPLHSKETNGVMNRVDLLIDYFYSYKISDWIFFGKVGTHLFGRQKIYQIDGDIQIDSSYTQVETDFGITYAPSALFFSIHGLLSQMTNFTSSSRKFTRATDKGYSVGGQIELGYNKQNLWLLSLGHQRRSDVFNAISDRVQDDLDYEYESGATWVKFKYLY
jgi:hypothetical protein